MSTHFGRHIGVVMIVAGAIIQAIGWVGLASSGERQVADGFVIDSISEGKSFEEASVGANSVPLVDGGTPEQDRAEGLFVLDHQEWIDSFLGVDARTVPDLQGGVLKSEGSHISSGPISTVSGVDTVLLQGKSPSIEKSPVHVVAQGTAGGTGSSVHEVANRTGGGSSVGNVADVVHRIEVREVANGHKGGSTEARKLLDEQWVKGRRTDRFTIQIRSGVSGGELEAYSDNTMFPEPMAAIKIGGFGNDERHSRYLVIAGDYASYVAAKTTALDLVSRMPGFKPWIRKFADVQVRLGG